LGDLVGHFGFLFLTLWLFAVAVCLAVTGLSALVGLASIVLILVLIILGNPSSGGPVPRPLLNGFYSGLNPVLPQGAALSALRGVPYFGDRGIDLGLLCLLIWVLAGLALLGATVFRDALRNWPSGP
jgi:ABC-type multidrug transport system permease subunit